MSDIQFHDDKYMELTSEFDQIRQCLGMYISRGNTDGAIHLFKEILNNSIDECLNKFSPSHKIYVTFNEEKRELTVTDEGRGIPIDKLVNVCTKKHTSTKFKNIGDNEQIKGTAGLNGRLMPL